MSNSIKPTTNHLESEKVLSLLKEIEANSHLTQRYLSQRLSISLGKINFLIKVLVVKGIIEIKNFKESKNKLGYVYLLTPNGINLKFKLAHKFLTWKLEEYEKLREEIEALKKEVVFNQGSAEQLSSLQLGAEGDPRETLKDK